MYVMLGRHLVMMHHFTLHNGLLRDGGTVQKILFCVEEKPLVLSTSMGKRHPFNSLPISTGHRFLT